MKTADDALVADAEPPEGFLHSKTRGPYTTHNGPFFHKVVEGGFQHGTRILARHCNSQGIAHGGMLMAFADGLLATAVYRETQEKSVTVKLNMDFLGPAQLGDWLAGTAEVDCVAGDMAYVRGWARANEQMVFKASAIFKIAASGSRDTRR